MHIDLTDRRKNGSSAGPLYFLSLALLNLNYNTHNSIQATFHCFSQIHLLRNKAKMTALSPKIEEPNVSHICCSTWLILLLPNCDFLNTLITPILPAEVSALCISVWDFYCDMSALSARLLFLRLTF